MTYTIQISGELTYVFKDGAKVGKFDTDTFLMQVISPLEFRQFERNPDKRKFNIRKLEFNLYNILS